MVGKVSENLLIKLKSTLAAFPGVTGLIGRMGREGEGIGIRQ